MYKRRSHWSIVLFLFTITVACLGTHELAAPSPAMGQRGAAPTTPDQEQIYYVAPDGSDENDGSADSPWRTLQHAVEQVGPGDTILVRSGTYRGMRIETSGMAGTPITLKAASGAHVIVDEPGPKNKHQSNIEVETWVGEGVVAYWIIEGLEVKDAPNWGIDLRGNKDHHAHHFIVRGNTVHHNGLSSGKTGIFTAFVDDITVENNESYANGEHGLYLSNSGDRFTVRGNQLHHNHFCGLHMNGDISLGGDGTISDGIVEANRIYENGEGGCAAINMDGVTDTVVRNNLLHHSHATGIALFQGNGAVCSRRNRILNNTILIAKDGRWAILVDDPACTDNKIFNNIIYSAKEETGSIAINLKGQEEIPGFESDYNAVTDRFSIDGGDTIISFAEWQALGYDLHSFIATPEELFVDPAGNNYHLRADSPAVEAGRTLPDVSEDFEGRPRPLGTASDIGAFEHGAHLLYLPLVLSP